MEQIEHIASMEAAIAKKTTDGNRVWMPSDGSFICLDVFIDGKLEKQHLHYPMDDSYRFWRGVLLFKDNYNYWKF